MNKRKNVFQRGLYYEGFFRRSAIVVYSKDEPNHYMLVLLINTVLSPNGVFIFSSKGESLAEKTWKKTQSHSEKLFPALEAIFKKAKKTWRDLDAICVVNGPGPFTSLRVGISLANAAGFALNIPVYSVPPLSLRALRSDRKGAEQSSLLSLTSCFRSSNQEFLQKHVLKLPEGQSARRLPAGRQGSNLLENTVIARSPMATEAISMRVLLKRIFLQNFPSKTQKIKSKTPFKPVLPIYGQEPNISKPKQSLTSL